MTVCSERHKRFWIRAGGADGADRRHRSAAVRLLRSVRRNWPVDVPYGGGGPSLLFLSYAVDAYHPGEGAGGAAWSTLHRHTEQGLHELARRGWRVLIKPHPATGLEVAA